MAKSNSNKRLEIVVGDPEEDNASCITYLTPIVPNQIDGWNLSKKDQMFRRRDYPPDKQFEQLPEQEQLKILAEVLKFRKEGYWFWNNGVETYITGIHWFYLNFWKIDIGYAQYRRSDRDFFYFWDACVNDPLCYGMVDMENRRQGKTEKSNCILYEYISITEESRAGIQSKTDGDAKKVFGKLVRSWKKVPYWLKPIDEGESQPKSALRFFEPSVRNTKGKRKEYGVALNSYIDYESAKTEAYDGEKLKRYTMDEAGKTAICSVRERWDIVKECFVLGPNIIGKALITTTVEEMEKKGGKYFKEIWDDSNMNDRDENGHTKTGLYRYFKPAWYCLEGFIDRYGNPMEAEAKLYLERKRKNIQGGSLAAEKRKYPFTVEDAFGVLSGAVWEDDVRAILEYAKKEIISSRVPIGYYNLFEKDGKVVANVTKESEDVVKILEPPQIDIHYKVGIDSISTDNQTGDEGGSRIACVVMKAYGGLERNSYEPVCTFSVRPARKESAYETICCIIRYYGIDDKVMVLGETNAGATDLLSYLINRGLKKFMQLKAKEISQESNLRTNTVADKYWQYRDDNLKEFQIGLGNRFLRRFGATFRMLSLVQSLIDLGNGKNADEADAFLMALLFFRDFDVVKKEKKKGRMMMMRVLDGGKIEWYDPVKEREEEKEAIEKYQKMIASINEGFVRGVKT